MTVAHRFVTRDGTVIDRAAALRRRYRQDRDKRLRPDGNERYPWLTGQLGRRLGDPFTQRAERAEDRPCHGRGHRRIRRPGHRSRGGVASEDP